jgi:hypothetical protein
MQNLWVLSSVVVPNGTIRQISSQDVAFNLEEVIERGSAAVDPSHVGIIGGKPMLSFETKGLKNALTLAGLNGLPIENQNIDFYFQRVARGSTRDPGNAIMIRGTVGMLVPKTIKAQHGSVATAGYDFHAISTDGETHPLAIFRDVSLPEVGLADELYTLGPAVIDGFLYDGLQSAEFDPSIEAMIEGDQGFPYPTTSGIATRTPKFTFGGKEMAVMTDDFFGVSGRPVTDWSVYLRRLRRGSTVYPAGESEHIRFFGVDGMLKPETSKASDAKPYENEYCLYPSIAEEDATAVQIDVESTIDI